MPHGATAFVRKEVAGALNLFLWTPIAAPGTPESLNLGDAEKDNTDEAGGMARDLAEILLNGQSHGASNGEELGLGYLNHGALVEV